MWKNYLNNCQSNVNTTDLTLKRMFDKSTRLVSEQDEISGLETIGCENHSWKYLSLIGDERIIIFQRTKVYAQEQTISVLIGLEFQKCERATCSFGSSVAREAHGRERVHEDGSRSRCITIETYNTIVMERIWVGKWCLSFHQDTGARDELVIAIREELSLHFGF